MKTYTGSRTHPLVGVTKEAETATKPSPRRIRSIRQMAAPWICPRGIAIGAKHIVSLRDTSFSPLGMPAERAISFYPYYKDRTV